MDNNVPGVSVSWCFVLSAVVDLCYRGEKCLLVRTYYLASLERQNWLVLGWFFSVRIKEDFITTVWG